MVRAGTDDMIEQERLSAGGVPKSVGTCDSDLVGWRDDGGLVARR